MTTEQKSKIISLRNAGYGYAAVAKEIGMSKSAVRKYCQGIGMSGDMEKHATTFPATRQFEDPTTSDYQLSHATMSFPTKVPVGTHYVVCLQRKHKILWFLTIKNHQIPQESVGFIGRGNHNPKRKT